VKRVSALAALIVVVAASSSSARSVVLWSGSFEPDLSAWTALQARPGGFAVVAAPAGRSGAAGQFTVRPGDMPAGTSGERSEIFKRTGEKEGVESFWTWSVYFPSSFVSNRNSAWNVFTQWHQDSNHGVQPVSFAVRNLNGREWLYLWAWGGDRDRPTRRAWILAPLVRAHWYDFAFHVIWSPDRHGLVEVWLNGKRVVMPTSTPTLYENDGVYLKQGFYRAAAPYVTSVLIAGTQRLSAFSGIVGGGRRGLLDPTQ
jgi:hypothetical protein